MLIPKFLRAAIITTTVLRNVTPCSLRYTDVSTQQVPKKLWHHVSEDRHNDTIMFSP